MEEQAHSSTETGESGDKTNIQEMLLELMKEFQDIRKDREQDRVDTKQEFRNMEENSNKRFQDMEANTNKRFQDLKVEFQQVRGEFQEETSSAQPNETVTPSETKVNSAKQHQEKETRLGRVRKSSDCHIIKCKRNTLTKHKTVKPQSELTKSNGKFRHPVFRTNPGKVETKMFQAIHHQVKSQNGSLFGKTQNTCVELTRRLGEHLGTKCHKCNENSSFLSDKFIEKLKNDSKVKRKTRLQMSVEKPCNECRNEQRLQLFQKGIKLTKYSNKMKTKWQKSVKKLGTNWPKLGMGKTTNNKIPFKMKRKEIINSKKVKVKMKMNSKPMKVGKPKWKIKFGI
jgi:hypothetical protein